MVSSERGAGKAKVPGAAPEEPPRIGVRNGTFGSRASWNTISGTFPPSPAGVGHERHGVGLRRLPPTPSPSTGLA